MISSLAGFEPTQTDLDSVISTAWLRPVRCTSNKPTIAILTFLTSETCLDQCPLVEADEEHDSTYVYHSESSGEEEVWTDLDKWRQKQQRVEAARDCQTLDSFFSRKPKTPNNGPLLVKSEQEPLSDLEQDPALQFTLSTGLDMADLCATYLETWLDEQGDDTLAASEAMTQHDPELHFCSEDSKYLPESAEIESACEWLDVNDKYNVEPHNTLLLVDACLKEAKKLRTSRLIKVITQLSAIAHMLRQSVPASVPALQLQGEWARDHTLLDKSVTIKDTFLIITAFHHEKMPESWNHHSPQSLQSHYKVIIPALDLTGDKSSISERTSLNWLKKLGYLCKNVQKGMYVDGHE
ncbi:hypothetical protein EV424DRAFT_1341031 [Suillus variegatus]|nr:hypothetical protein EV424DRAFT_1341031 [Suillus variegatus]